MKEQLKAKIELLTRQLEEFTSELYKLDNSILMKSVIKGKPTLQIHPYSQMQNLKHNGWKIATELDIKEFSEYIKKETLKQ